jgi:hypothetical protein
MIDLARLDSLWQRNWGGPLDADLLRSRFADRWVRFHSLPGSKRYAETVDEAAEVQRRHGAVLADLGPASGLIVLAQDYAPGDGFAGWVARELPGARLWRTVPEGAEPATTFWVADALTPELWASIADGRAGSVVIADRDLSWLYHPYDGGADVIAASTAERDRLRAAHPAWLSLRPDGL